MKSPGISDLPPLHNDKVGWPWTEDSRQLPDLMIDGQPWPKISIITPSYNQGQYLEETIRSVLLQGYPNYEYIVIDGGSSDDSLSILKKYSQFITKWTSEPDKGQSDAINKGFKLAKGEIVAWINSDDLYAQEAFSLIALHFAQNPNISMIYGDCEFIDEFGEKLSLCRSREFDIQKLVEDCYIPQPSVFFKETIFESLGYLDESLHYAMDYEYWIRIGLHFNMQYIPFTIAKFRLHSESKTISKNDLFVVDIFHIYEKFIKSNSVSREQFDMILSELIWKILRLENFTDIHLLFSNRDATPCDEVYSRIFTLNIQNKDDNICQQSFEKIVQGVYKCFFINYHNSNVTDKEIDRITNDWYESQNLKIIEFSFFLFKRDRIIPAMSIFSSYILCHPLSLLNSNFLTSLIYAIKRKMTKNI